MKENFVCGIHAVKNILLNSPDRVHKVLTYKDIKNSELWEILKEAKKLKITVVMHDRDYFKNRYGAHKHQGVVAIFGVYDYHEFEEFEKYVEVVDNDEKPNVVFADSINDPQNLGAILRTCYLQGIEWVFVPKKNSAPITETVVSSSTGAVFKMNIVKIKLDYRDFCNRMKGMGYKLFALEAGESRLVEDVKLKKDDKFMLITGSEGFGVNGTLKRNADEILRLRMKEDSEINSYNTSVALSISLYTILSNVEE